MEKKNVTVTLKNSKVAQFYFGIGARESALFLDRILTIQEYKERLGSSYNKATTWYALLNKKSVSKFTNDDYRDCYHQWMVMTSLGEMVGTIELEDGSKKDSLQLEERYIDKSFVVMQKIFGISSNVTSSEDKIEFIQSCLQKFNRETKTEMLHKASIKIIKMSFEDIQNNGSGYVFDSRNCGKGNMRYILTSEDGISRLLSDIGKEQVVINLNTSHLENGSKEDAERYYRMKEQLFLDGITDIATGKHYLCSAPSASSTRHVDFPFVRADKPEEVYDIWCKITGFSNITELASNIGKQKADGSISVIFAKIKARIAQNGANSLSTGRTASERIRNRLRKANVAFVSDCKGSVDTPYKKISTTGILTMELPDGTVVDERVE
jgi:hypothetical protein